MIDLREWFLAPKSTLISPEDANPIGITPGLMGADAIEPVAYQRSMIDLGVYRTPWCILFNRSKATITGT